MLSFVSYVAYTQAHSFAKSIQAVCLGETVTLDVTRPLMDALQVQLHRAPDSEPLATGRVMYLANHRSWADFVIDSVLTNGGSYLARYGVFFGVPMSCFYGWVSGSVFFFHRRRGIDRDWLAGFIETNWRYRPAKGLIVYPEGTRNLGSESLPLKKGALEAAYKLQVPIQVLITTNKEHMVNERKLKVERNTRMVVYYSCVLHPRDFATLQDWYKAIQELWDDSWQRAHAAVDTKPFEGKSSELLLKADSEPAVMHRIWILRVALLVCTAFAINQLVRK